MSLSQLGLYCGDSLTVSSHQRLCGQAAQGLQEGREDLPAPDSGGQRGRKQHLERELHPADVAQDSGVIS